MTASPAAGAAHRGRTAEVLWAFFKLGLTSFGGPVAHLGYFKAEFVDRRRWLDEASYGDLVALSQFLPGPASSKVSIGLGLGRAGWPGALAAWVGFTLPSAVALVLFALGVARWSGLTGLALVHGLKLAAVAVVAHAVWGMARTLCPDGPRAVLAISATLLCLAVPGSMGQLAAIAAGGFVGWLVLPAHRLPPMLHRDPGVRRRTGALLLVLFGVLLLALPVAARMTGSLTLEAVARFYQAGALVFGGGHVVLPLLQAAVVPPGWVGNDVFLAGYGAAQAVPGPLFTFSAYLGAVMPLPWGAWGNAGLMLVAIFLPGFLLIAGALPFWEGLRRHVPMRQALAGIHAAVVGILGAALYDPVWVSAIHGHADLALALVAFALLASGRVPPLAVVVATALAAWGWSAWG